MKRFILSIILVLTVMPMVDSASNVRNADVPVISTMLEQRDGTRIKLSFLTLHWDAEMINNMKTSKEMRDYYNANILPKMGILETNIRIKYGPRYQIEPGQYYLGLRMSESLEAGKEPGWWLLISNEQMTLIDIPLNIIIAEHDTPHLCFMFSPGITDRDFMFNMMYGNLMASVRWTISGIPSMTMPSESKENAAWKLPKPGQESVSPENILKNNAKLKPQAIVPTPTPAKSKAKAGSGSLRYLKDKSDKEN